MNHSLRHSNLKSRVASVLLVVGKKYRTLFGVAMASTVAAGCAQNAPQDTWQPKGPNAKIIDDLQQPVFAVAGIIGLIVAVAIIYVIFK